MVATEPILSDELITSMVRNNEVEEGESDGDDGSDTVVNYVNKNRF